MTLALVFLIVALILAILASVGVPSGPIGLFPLSFAFYLGSLLVTRL